MKLTRAKVQNFRSVEDSGEFKFDKHSTCLVGKNEAGKTALLTALYRLNPIFDADSKFDRQQDYPRRYLADYEERHKGEDPNVVTTWWELEPSDKEKVSKAVGAAALPDNEIEVSKGYDNTTYWNPKINEEAIVQHFIDSGTLHDEEKMHVGGAQTIAALKAKLAAIPEASPRRDELIKKIDAIAPQASAWEAVTELLELPKFLYFAQYQRMQGQVSLEQIQQKKKNGSLDGNDQVFVALCDMASVTIEEVAAIKQFESLVARFEGASNKISAEIFRYWSQNKFLKVQFRLDPAQPGDPAPYNSGNIFRTRIYNQLHEVTVPFDDRSTGFVWFFSFLALFSQVKKRTPGQLILLLDEPGLSLHGKAQADLVRYFKEKLAPPHQLIYTTHSPFMVPPDNLLSARTVEDVVIFREGEQPEVHGTKVSGDVLSTDKDTLFPLQGALGYEITQTLFVGEHTLLVEGPGDLLYLAAVSAELRDRSRTPLDSRWTICPCGGIDKVSAFMSLFGGNRLHVAVLTDFASGQKRKVEDLRRSKILKDGHVLTMDTYAGQAEADIEDVLGATFYVDLVNACYDLPVAQAATVPLAGTRVLKHVEDHFRTLPAAVPEFNHYSPASYLTEHRGDIIKKVATTEVEAALSRFEKLFTDLNALLPPKK
jgi:predicted ATP-dependent endonuclease of OLD family